MSYSLCFCCAERLPSSNVNEDARPRLSENDGVKTFLFNMMLYLMSNAVWISGAWWNLYTKCKLWCIFGC